MKANHIPGFAVRLALALLFVPAICAADASWSFVMMGDTRGTGQPSEGTVTTTGISVNLHAIAAKITTLHPELVLVAGDLCNGDDVYDPHTGQTPSNPPVIPYATQFANWNGAMARFFGVYSGKRSSFPQKKRMRTR